MPDCAVSAASSKEGAEEEEGPAASVPLDAPPKALNQGLDFFFCVPDSCRGAAGVASGFVLAATCTYHMETSLKPRLPAVGGGLALPAGSNSLFMCVMRSSASWPCKQISSSS